MVVVSAVRESVRMVTSFVLGWSCRAFAMPVRSPSATDAIFPRYVALDGCISPQVDAPLSVIAPPATLPSAPEPSVYIVVAVGLLGGTMGPSSGLYTARVQGNSGQGYQQPANNTGGNSIQVANAMQKKKKTRADAARLKA